MVKPWIQHIDGGRQHLLKPLAVLGSGQFVLMSPFLLVIEAAKTFPQQI